MWILWRQRHGRDSRDMHRRAPGDARQERCSGHELPGVMATVVAAAAAAALRVVARATGSGKGKRSWPHDVWISSAWKTKGNGLLSPRGRASKSTTDWHRESHRVVSQP